MPMHHQEGRLPLGYQPCKPHSACKLFFDYPRPNKTIFADALRKTTYHIGLWL